MIDNFSKTELAPLIAAIRHRYTYDFSRFNAMSFGRRVKWTMLKAKITDLAQFQQRILAEPELFQLFVENLSINITSMFRNPSAFIFLRRQVIPILATYPHIRIWCAGVASGEEAYSMAILLREEGIYHRSLIYATDFNPVILKQAARGCLPLKRMQEYTRNYIEAGGTTAFSSYYRVSANLAHLDAALRKNIIFSTHNLISDGVFNEFHLILCRNVLIYFDEQLNERVVELLKNSLALRSYLFLGETETLEYSNANRYFENISQNNSIYRLL